MRILGAIVASVLFLTLPVQAEETPRITVIGEGQVEAAPDMATISLGVTAQAETAKAAVDETSAGVAALLGKLSAAGIEGRDIQTSSLTLNPVWDQRSYETGTPRISGFIASNTVTVRVRALETLGGVLDSVLEAGANTFNGLSFGLQDPTPQRDAARTAAIADARRKAELYAAAAGVTLGPVLAISEAQEMQGPQPMFRMEAAMDSSAVPVAPGELSLSARITVVWALGQ